VSGFTLKVKAVGLTVSRLEALAFLVVQIYLVSKTERNVARHLWTVNANYSWLYNKRKSTLL